ncbi:unnamed protein product [Rhizoctonia solani]|uniref:Uncharacterized protein n=1 Tax=Rhizoctonia solani TaxID=456999 RepID=A0A8H2XNV2_9AGAM|nr:unnamed protein product [Rhizoctonia solani]
MGEFPPGGGPSGASRETRTYSKVAPALQAAQERLQRSQLEDKLEKALENRPKPEELVSHGILSKDEIPPS